MQKHNDAIGRKYKGTGQNSMHLPQHKQLELPINWHRNYQKYKKTRD